MDCGQGERWVRGGFSKEPSPKTAKIKNHLRNGHGVKGGRYWIRKTPLKTWDDDPNRSFKGTHETMAIQSQTNYSQHLRDVRGGDGKNKTHEGQKAYRRCPTDFGL